MTLVTVDMDDTLIPTKQDYHRSSERFGEYMETNFGIDSERAIRVQEDIDFQLMKANGLNMERHINSFEKAIRELVDNPTDEQIQTVRSFGEDVFKTEQEYAERGFLPGAKEMISVLRQTASSVHLVTIGDERVQQRKINALNLSDRFDGVHIPSYEEGKDSVFTELLSTTRFEEEHLIHIGNSEGSDIEPVLSVGGNAVFIPDGDGDWFSDGDTPSFTDNDSVYKYTTAREFVDDARQIIESHAP